MIYSQETADIICNLIIEGYDLRQIGKIKGLPSKATICRWLKDSRKIYFIDEYRKAKEIQHYMVCDELFDLAKQYGIPAVGRLAGRVHKLHPKSNLSPTNALVREVERRARLAYTPDGKKCG